MKLTEIADNPGSRPSRMRVGRGIGSGKGKTSGAGVKGQKARSGVAIKGFEGGQMPIHRRLPKGGFKNLFRVAYLPVNLGKIQAAVDAGRIQAGATVTPAVLSETGVLGLRRGFPVRLLADGEIKVALTFEVDAASAKAVEAVQAAGGTVNIIPKREVPRKEGKKAERRKAQIAKREAREAARG
ncbi:50S ribosomal protein L15 [Zavarzinia marina]|uniref:50S ribosomal protein L15 n=1 Tax=Zavarzinia marina TaxID=2911065 RepID=UPI0038B573F6